MVRTLDQFPTPTSETAKTPEPVDVDKSEEVDAIADETNAQIKEEIDEMPKPLTMSKAKAFLLSLAADTIAFALVEFLIKKRGKATFGQIKEFIKTNQFSVGGNVSSTIAAFNKRKAIPQGVILLKVASGKKKGDKNGNIWQLCQQKAKPSEPEETKTVSETLNEIFEEPRPATFEEMNNGLKLFKPEAANHIILSLAIANNGIVTKSQLKEALKDFKADVVSIIYAFNIGVTVRATGLFFKIDIGNAQWQIMKRFGPPPKKEKHLHDDKDEQPQVSVKNSQATLAEERAAFRVQKQTSIAARQAARINAHDNAEGITRAWLQKRGIKPRELGEPPACLSEAPKRRSKHVKLDEQAPFNIATFAETTFSSKEDFNKPFSRLCRQFKKNSLSGTLFNCFSKAQCLELIATLEQMIESKKVTGKIVTGVKKMINLLEIAAAEAEKYLETDEETISEKYTALLEKGLN